MTSKVQLNDFQEDDAKYVGFSLMENLAQNIDSLKKQNLGLKPNK